MVLLPLEVFSQEDGPPDLLSWDLTMAFFQLLPEVAGLLPRGTFH